MEARLAGSKMGATRSGGFLRYFKLECSFPISTLNGHVVADVNHEPMFNNLDGTCVSDNLKLGSSTGYGGLNNHDGDSNGPLKYLKAQCPLPIYIFSGDGVADVSHIPVISTIDGACENLSL